jgi:hypothetical protein
MEEEKAVRDTFLFSPIFEQEADCQNNPFVFEKFELQPIAPNDVPKIRKQGHLLKRKKIKKVIQLSNS